MRNLGIISLLCLSVSAFASSEDKWGFEVGNGRKDMHNPTGRYGMRVPDQMEVGYVDEFTEVITPLNEGTPRTRLQVNVVKGKTPAHGLNALETWGADNGGARKVSLAGMNGTMSQTRQLDGRREIEIRLQRTPSEMVVIHLEGRPGTKAFAAFQKIVDSLGTFETLAF